MGCMAPRFVLVLVLVLEVTGKSEDENENEDEPFPRLHHALRIAPCLHSRPSPNTQTAMTPLSMYAVDALVRADHGDPFALLGMHESAGQLVVRVFRPDAAEVEVREIGDDGRSWRATRLNPEGFFEASLDR